LDVDPNSPGGISNVSVEFQFGGQAKYKRPKANALHDPADGYRSAFHQTMPPADFNAP
jgi:hypothetical protein